MCEKRLKIGFIHLLFGWKTKTRECLLYFYRPSLCLPWGLILSVVLNTCLLLILFCLPFFTSSCSRSVHSQEKWGWNGMKVKAWVYRGLQACEWCHHYRVSKGRSVVHRVISTDTVKTTAALPHRKLPILILHTSSFKQRSGWLWRVSVMACH